MAGNGYRGGIPLYDLTLASLYRSALLILIPFVALSLGLVPPVAVFVVVVQNLSLPNPLHILFLCFLIVALFVMLMFCETVVPGLLIKVLRLKLSEGTYQMSIRDPEFFRFALFNVLYQAPLKLIAPFRVMILRRLIYRLSGMRLGRTAILSGTEFLFDPSVTEIGEETFIGGHAKIFGHTLEDRFYVQKVRIGNRCLIGGDVCIMPGAVIKDDVVLGIRSLVLKNQVLKKGKTYAGVPAKQVNGKRERSLIIEQKGRLADG